MKTRTKYTLASAVMAAAFITNTAIDTRSASATNLSAATVLANTKEVNYYPAQNGWTYMWTRSDPATINADFAKISSQGFNTVRIIAQAVPGAFTYPQPTSAELSQLAQVITMASSHNLKVHLTLFDFWSQYTDDVGSQQWIDAIVKPLAGDPRVSIIELQNEIDPYNTAAMQWAQGAIPYIKSISGGIPVTISEYGVDRMQALVNNLASTPPDFYSYHAYSTNGLLYSDISRVKTIVGGTPLFIGEAGYSTSSQNAQTPAGLATNQTSQEAFQEYTYRNLVNTTRTLSLPFPSPWVYSDFSSTAIPYTTTPDQYNFGMNRLDGTAKPVVASYQSLLGGAAVDTSFNNGFEKGDGQLPTLWRIYQNASLGFTATFARDGTVSHSGSASASIAQSTQSTSGQASFYLNPLLPTIPGKTYTFSGWVKGSGVTGSNGLSIAWFDNNGAYLTQSFSSNAPTGTYNWTQLGLSSVAPANAAKYEIHLNSAANSGKIWFDDITLVKN